MDPKVIEINNSKLETFDIVVNATYANVNLLAHWLNFKKKGNQIRSC